MVVNVMNGGVHASIKCLEGYTAIHRLFLMFIEEYPKLLDQVKQIFSFSHFFLKKLSTGK